MPVRKAVTSLMEAVQIHMVHSHISFTFGKNQVLNFLLLEFNINY